jgi:hypothetical protein
MGLVSEFRRRNVLRMAVLFAVAAGLIMQVAEVIIGLANLIATKSYKAQSVGQHDNSPRIEARL